MAEIRKIGILSEAASHAEDWGHGRGDPRVGKADDIPLVWESSYNFQNQEKKGQESMARKGGGGLEN